MQKPKILIALFRMPYPATDGTRHKILHNLAEGLLRDFEIEFFVVSIKSFAQDDVAYLEKHFGKVHVFGHSKVAYFLSSLPALMSGLPLQAEAFRFRDAQQWLDAHVRDYDAFYVHEIRMTEFFIRYDDAIKNRILVDFNDAISMSYRASLSRLSLAKRLFYRWEGKRVARYESRVLESFVHFNVVSDIDRKYLLDAPSHTGQKTVDFQVIAHGSPVSPDVAVLDQDKIFFMGSLDYEPNRDALVHFIASVWPKLRTQIPVLEFLVIGGGRIPSGLADADGVRFLGFVPDVFDSVRHCKALVAPIRFAGGTPSKILDAMGYGIPVITSTIGAAGISGAESGRNLVTVDEDDAQAWVAAIGRIVKDFGIRTAMAASARQLVVERYSSEAAQESFRRRFHEILGK